MKHTTVPVPDPTKLTTDAVALLKIDGLDEKINDLKERMASVSSREWSSIGGYIVGAAGIISIILFILSRTNIHV